MYIDNCLLFWALQTPINCPLTDKVQLCYCQLRWFSNWPVDVIFDASCGWFTIVRTAWSLFLISATIKTGRIRISPHWVLISCKVFVPFNRLRSFFPRATTWLASLLVASLKTHIGEKFQNMWLACLLSVLLGTIAVVIIFYSSRNVEVSQCMLSTNSILRLQIVDREENVSNENDRCPIYKRIRKLSSIKKVLILLWCESPAWVQRAGCWRRRRM